VCVCVRVCLCSCGCPIPVTTCVCGGHYAAASAAQLRRGVPRAQPRGDVGVLVRPRGEPVGVRLLPPGCAQHVLHGRRGHRGARGVGVGADCTDAGTCAVALPRASRDGDVWWSLGRRGRRRTRGRPRRGRRPPLRRPCARATCTARPPRVRARARALCGWAGAAWLCVRRLSLLLMLLLRGCESVYSRACLHACVPRSRTTTHSATHTRTLSFSADSHGCDHVCRRPDARPRRGEARGGGGGTGEAQGRDGRAEALLQQHGGGCAAQRRDALVLTDTRDCAVEDVSAEAMEAYRMKKPRADDPMAKFL
jgi:hypothetical protein